MFYLNKLASNKAIWLVVYILTIATASRAELVNPSRKPAEKIEEREREGKSPAWLVGWSG